MADYNEMLNRSWDAIPKTQVLPVGSWLLEGRNMIYMDKSGTTNARVLAFYKPLEAMADVPTANLEALGKDYDLSNNDIVKTFWIERNKDWDELRDHLALHGIETKGQSQIDTFKAFKGKKVVAYLDIRNFKKKDGTVSADNDPVSFAPFEG